MKRVIYIRHGTDVHNNYRHDEKLTQKGKKESYRLAKELIEKYGVPDIIYYSPSYRTFQTAKYMKKALKNVDSLDKRSMNLDNEKKIKVEPRLGRFFTNTEKKSPDVHRNSIKRGILIEETWEKFHERIDEQFYECKKSEHQVIWNITHSLVLLRVAKLNNIERDRHVKYSDFCVI
jgi:broad specificity phosphatase PhoE